MSLQQEDARLLLKQTVVKEKMQSHGNFGHMVTIPKDFYKRQKEFISSVDDLQMQSLYNFLIVSRKSRLVSYAEALIPLSTIEDALADEEVIFYTNLLQVASEFSDEVKL